MRTVALLAFAAAGAAGSLVSRTRPVAKVIKLLKDMKSQLELEAADDEEVYGKLTCWCKTNREEKTSAIALAEKRIEQLEAEIGEDAAKMKQLKAKELATREENRKNQKALDEATELRMKERKEFHEEEKDSLATIDACKQAVTVLSKHHPELAQLKSVAKTLLHSRKLAESSSSQSSLEGIVALKGFLNDVSNAGSFLQIPGFQSYAPQSGQIFGMLKQMKETFEANLSTAQKEEVAKREAYAELKAAKEAELKAGRASLENTKQEYAKVKANHAEAEEDLSSTQEQLAIDQEFLANLEKRCAQTDADYAARTKSRNEEIAAVGDTIQILNADAAFDSFDKTVATNDGLGRDAMGFLQTRMQSKKQQVVALLEQAQHASPAGQNSGKIAMIATYAKLDAFVKVKKAIEGMVTELKAQQADEVKHRDFCVAEFNENESQTLAEQDNHDGLVAKIADLTASIEKLTSEIDTLNKEIAEMKTQATRAGSDRARENADFQRDVQDQRVTQGILAKAVERMSQKYYLLQGAPHIQTSGTKTDPGNGPAKFASYENNAGGKKVIALLESVIADSKAQEKELEVSEKDAQTAYEGFIKDTNQSVDAKQKAVVSKTEARANAKLGKSEASNSKDASVKALNGLHDYKQQLHGSCDFVMKNFDARQQARTEEMEALKQASNILSGMK
jgi:hypothetical protein